MIFLDDHSKKYWNEKLPKFVFINPESTIDPETNLPEDSDNYQIVDIFEIINSGVPYDDYYDIELQLHAIIMPDEKEVF